MLAVLKLEYWKFHYSYFDSLDICNLESFLQSGHNLVFFHNYPAGFKIKIYLAVTFQ